MNLLERADFCEKCTCFAIRWLRSSDSRDSCDSPTRSLSVSRSLCRALSPYPSRQLAQRVCDGTNGSWYQMPYWVRCLMSFCFLLPCWALEIRCLIQIVIFVFSLSCWLLLSRAVLGFFDASFSSWHSMPEWVRERDDTPSRQSTQQLFANANSSYVCHDSFTRVAWLIYMCDCRIDCHEP